MYIHAFLAKSVSQLAFNSGSPCDQSGPKRSSQYADLGSLDKPGSNRQNQ